MKQKEKTMNRLGISAALVLLLTTFPCVAEEQAMLVIERVRVRTTKEDGKSAWDTGGGAPDLKVSVERTSKPKGERHVTAPRKDRFEATFNRKAIGVDEGDVIEFRVLDEDFASDDEIGKISRKITAGMLKSGELKLAFDQVDELIIRFERD